MAIAPKIANKYLSVLFVILWTACSPSDAPDIPWVQKATIKIDGLFDSTEWKQSSTIRLTPNNCLYLMQDEESLFLGLRHNEDVKRYVDLYFHNDSIGTINLHASMQLGERVLKDRWNDTIPGWSWGNNTYWMANRVEIRKEANENPFPENLNPYEGHEFQISKKKLKGKQIKLRLEIRDFMGKASDLSFPVHSQRYQTDQWMLLRLE